MAILVGAQGYEPEPKFRVKLLPDREPLIAGEELRLAVVITVDDGWHINSNDPGDEFSIPTSLQWRMPEAWSEPLVAFPPGEKQTFASAEEPVSVWHGKVAIVAVTRVPVGSDPTVKLKVEVTGQACNDSQCLPPMPVSGRTELAVAPAGATAAPVNQELFAAAAAITTPTAGEADSQLWAIPVALRWSLGLVLILLGCGLAVLRPGSEKPTPDRCWRLLTGILVVGGVMLLPLAPDDRVHLPWQPFDDAAVQAAVQSGSPVIVDFYADWCGPCRELDERTFSDPLVAAQLANYARFKADFTTGADDEVKKSYAVHGMPTVIVYSSGEEAFRKTGFFPPQELLELLGGDGAAGGGVGDRLASAGLPFQIVIVFLAGLALNLTPCIYPLIPITFGFFAQQAKGRSGGTFVLAVIYVLGMSVTYSVLGVTASLTGQLFGAALQNPWVTGGIVAVILALASSMFGLWELRVPGWIMQASGGRSGHVGAALMGLVVGFVAAPCIGPFVLSLLTYVGQKGDPVLGFVLFFTLAMGLGLPFLLLGTFTGAVSGLPAAGNWMVGVRLVFGVILIALAGYFAAPLLPGSTGNWLIAATLVLGGAYLLLIQRTGHEQVLIDRVMRVVCAALVAIGLLFMPLA